MRTRSGLFAAIALGLVAGLASFSAEPAAMGLPLDIRVDWAPVHCGGTLYLFSSGGRNQIMGPEDSAPNCDPVHMSPLLQPACGGDGIWVLDRKGTLWELGRGIPTQVAADLGNAVALVPYRTMPVVFFPHGLRLPDGTRKKLKLNISHAVAMGQDGFWVWGPQEAARLDASGSILWTWKPERGRPGPATLAGTTVFAGTSAGDLVALKSGNGRVRFAYRGGGEVVSVPLVLGGEVVYASLDHFIRAVKIRDGQLAWQFRAEGRPSFGPFKVGAGILFAESAGSRLVILDPEDGHAGWTWKVPEGSILKCPAVSTTNAVVLAWTSGPNPVMYRVALPSSLPKQKRLKSAPAHRRRGSGK